jgi:hypothetical protein
VVLLKPGKIDRTKVKAYRPIALLSTLGKGLEAIIAQTIASVEKMQLLSKPHLGGRTGMPTEHALYGLAQQVF